MCLFRKSYGEGRIFFGFLSNNAYPHRKTVYPHCKNVYPHCKMHLDIRTEKTYNRRDDGV